MDEGITLLNLDSLIILQNNLYAPVVCALLTGGLTPLINKIHEDAKNMSRESFIQFLWPARRISLQ